MIKFFGPHNIENGYLSNFFKCDIIYDRKKFCCSEQIFMFVKANFFNDMDIARKIVESKNMDPNFYKSLGRKVKNYDEDKWNKIRYEVMLDCLRAKFKVPELRQRLLNTENKELVEASPYDKIWGIGLRADNPGSNDKSRWLGQNLLGKALMEIREEIKFEEDNCRNNAIIHSN